MLGKNDQQGMLEFKGDDDSKDRTENRLKNCLVDRIDPDVDNQMPDRPDQMHRRNGADQHNERDQGQDDRLFKALIECQAAEQSDEAGPVPAVLGTFHGNIIHNRFPIQ